MTDYEDFDREVDRFLKKEMTPAEEAAFTERLNADPELLERAQVIALAIEQMGAARKEDDQKILDRYRSRPRLWRYAAAAVVVMGVGLGGYKYYQYDRTMALAAEFCQSFEVVTRGGSDEASRQLAALFAQVKTGNNLAVVRPVLSRLYEQSKSAEYNEYTDYCVDIAWNLAIVCLKENDRREALKVLREIAADNKGKAVAARARQLIRRIENL